MIVFAENITSVCMQCGFGVAIQLTDETVKMSPNWCLGDILASGVTLIPNQSRSWYFRFLYAYKKVCVCELCVCLRACLPACLSVPVCVHPVSYCGKVPLYSHLFTKLPFEIKYSPKSSLVLIHLPHRSHLPAYY